MSTIKTKFTLHREYKHFIPGVTPLNFGTLGSSCGVMGCLLPVALFYTVFACAMVFILYEFNVKPLVFRVLGREVSARVIGCDVITGKHDAEIGVSYRYSYTWSGVSYSDTGRVYGEGLSDCQQSESVTVDILPANPDVTLLAKYTLQDSFMAGLILMMGLFVIFGALAMGYGYIQYIRNSWMYPRLVKSGVVREGYITHISGETASKSRSYWVSLKYQVKSPTGKVLKGSGRAHRQDLEGKQLPPVGTPVAVLYADDHAHMVL